MKSIITLGLAAACFAALSSCTAPATPPDPGSATAPGAQATKKLKIGIVFDKGGLGDKSFNDSANVGLERAKKDFAIDAFPVQSKTDADYETDLRALADKGSDLVIAVGISMEPALKKVAAEYPKINFAIIDGGVKAANVRALLFKEEEGSFLVGYLAGLVTKTNKIGFVGGMQLALIEKFEFGFAAGALMANPKVVFLPAKFTGDWDNQDKAKVSANVLYGDGADIIYAAAGRAGLGVIGAAKDQKKFAIGVDSDQDSIAPGSVLTSMIKRVDEAVYSTISELKDGHFEAGDKIYDLKAKGVGISALTFTKELVGPENLKKVEAIQQQIVDGKLTVPSTKAGYEIFVSKTNK